MRKKLLTLTIILVIASCATGVRASTDCERWIAQYKTQLAQTRAAKRAIAAKRRMRAYAHRKLVQYTRPRPVVQPLVHHVPTHPRLTPAQMLRRFDLLCGVLPEDAGPVLMSKGNADFLPGRDPLGPMDLLSSPETGLLSRDEGPVNPADSGNPQSGSGLGPMGGGSGPGFGPGGFAGAPGTGGMPSGGPGGSGPSGPGTAGGPGTGSGAGGPGSGVGGPGSGGPGAGGPGGSNGPGGTGPGGFGGPGAGGPGGSGLPIVTGTFFPPSGPLVPEVPEPNSVVLVMTGLAGLGEMLRRRSR